MAHDFLITDVLDALDDDGDPMDILQKMKAGRSAVFNGYGDAAMYKAFGAQEFDAGVSGCFGGKVITRQEAIDGLSKAFDLLAHYPDPKRADALKAYLSDVVMQSDHSAMYRIFYS
jgi:hypothetical protein